MNSTILYHTLDTGYRVWATNCLDWDVIFDTPTKVEPDELIEYKGETFIVEACEPMKGGES